MRPKDRRWKRFEGSWPRAERQIWRRRSRLADLQVYDVTEVVVGLGAGVAPVLPLFDSQTASHLPGQIESPLERALSRRDYRDGAGAVAAAQPALREAGPAQGRAEYAGDVRSALTPVQAWPAEEVSANAFVAADWRCVEIDAEGPQENCASFHEHPAISEQFNTPFPTWPPTKPIAPGCGTIRSAAKITRSPGRDVSFTARIAFSCA